MKRVAFTLVELLVVICILGMLVGLMIPAVQAFRHGTAEEQHISVPTPVTVPKPAEKPEIAIEKSDGFQYYVRIDGHRYMIVVKDLHKPEIFNCD